MDAKKRENANDDEERGRKKNKTPREVINETKCDFGFFIDDGTVLVSSVTIDITIVHFCAHISVSHFFYVPKQTNPEIPVTFLFPGKFNSQELL
jgi:hypothetical protein